MFGDLYIATLALLIYVNFSSKMAFNASCDPTALYYGSNSGGVVNIGADNGQFGKVIADTVECTSLYVNSLTNVNTITQIDLQSPIVQVATGNTISDTVIGGIAVQYGSTVNNNATQTMYAGLVRMPISVTQPNASGRFMLIKDATVQNLAGGNDADLGLATLYSNDICNNNDISTPVLITNQINPITTGGTIAVGDNKSTFQVNGSLAIESELQLNDGLSVIGGTITDTLHVTGAVTLDQKLQLTHGFAVTKGATIDSLHLTGTATLDQELQLTHGLSVTGGTTTDTLHVTGTVSLGQELTLTNGLSVTGGTGTDSLTVGSIDLANDLNIDTGAIVMQAGSIEMAAGDISMAAGGIELATGDITVAVGGINVAAGNIAVPVGSITSASATIGALTTTSSTLGNAECLSVNSTGSVTGTVITGTELSITGTTTLNGTVTCGTIDPIEIFTVNSGGSTIINSKTVQIGPTTTATGSTCTVNSDNLTMNSSTINIATTNPAAKITIGNLTGTLQDAEPLVINCPVNAQTILCQSSIVAGPSVFSEFAGTSSSNANPFLISIPSGSHQFYKSLNTTASTQAAATFDSLRIPEIVATPVEPVSGPLLFIDGTGLVKAGTLFSETPIVQGDPTPQLPPPGTVVVTQPNGTLSGLTGRATYEPQAPAGEIPNYTGDAFCFETALCVHEPTNLHQPLYVGDQMPVTNPGVGIKLYNGDFEMDNGDINIPNANPPIKGLGNQVNTNTYQINNNTTNINTNTYNIGVLSTDVNNNTTNINITNTNVTDINGQVTNNYNALSNFLATYIINTTGGNNNPSLPAANANPVNSNGTLTTTTPSTTKAPGTTIPTASGPQGYTPAQIAAISASIAGFLGTAPSLPASAFTTAGTTGKVVTVPVFLAATHPATGQPYSNTSKGLYALVPGGTYPAGYPTVPPAPPVIPAPSSVAYTYPSGTAPSTVPAPVAGGPVTLIPLVPTPAGGLLHSTSSADGLDNTALVRVQPTTGSITSPGITVAPSTGSGSTISYKPSSLTTQGTNGTNTTQVTTSNSSSNTPYAPNQSAGLIPGWTVPSQYVTDTQVSMNIAFTGTVYGSVPNPIPLIQFALGNINSPIATCPLTAGTSTTTDTSYSCTNTACTLPAGLWDPMTCYNLPTDYASGYMKTMTITWTWTMDSTGSVTFGIYNYGQTLGQSPNLATSTCYCTSPTVNVTTVGVQTYSFVVPVTSLNVQSIAALSSLDFTIQNSAGNISNFTTSVSMTYYSTAIATSFTYNWSPTVQNIHDLVPVAGNVIPITATLTDGDNTHYIKNISATVTFVYTIGGQTVMISDTPIQMPYASNGIGLMVGQNTSFNSSSNWAAGIAQPTTSTTTNINPFGIEIAQVPKFWVDSTGATYTQHSQLDDSNGNMRVGGNLSANSAACTQLTVGSTTLSNSVGSGTTTTFTANVTAATGTNYSPGVLCPIGSWKCPSDYVNGNNTSCTIAFSCTFYNSVYSSVPIQLYTQYAALGVTANTPIPNPATYTPNNPSNLSTTASNSQYFPYPYTTSSTNSQNYNVAVVTLPSNYHTSSATYVSISYTVYNTASSNTTLFTNINTATVIGGTFTVLANGGPFRVNAGTTTITWQIPASTFNGLTLNRNDSFGIGFDFSQCAATVQLNSVSYSVTYSIPPPVATVYSNTYTLTGINGQNFVAGTSYPIYALITGSSTSTEYITNATATLTFVYNVGNYSLQISNPLNIYGCVTARYEALNNPPHFFCGNEAAVGWNPGGAYGLGLNSAGQLVLNSGTGIGSYNNGVLKSTLDDGSGNAVLGGYVTNKTLSVWTSLSLVNNWVNYGAGWQLAQYYIDALGWVNLRGLIKGGTQGVTAFTFPASYAPNASIIFLVPTGGQYIELRIAGQYYNGDTGQTAGNGYLTAGSGTVSYISLNGIRWQING